MSRLSGRRILIVEDEFFIADDLATAVKQAGAQVVGPVSSQRDALELLANSVVDLAILDINLRGETSFTIADELAARHLPFVFATGYDAWSLPERHADRPVWRKPFDSDALVAALGG